MTGVDTYGHDCEHVSLQHGADGCNVPGCLCAFQSWDEAAFWTCICGSGDDGEWHSLMCVASNTPDEEWKA